MSEEPQKRSKLRPAPEAPTGYRSSRRGAKGVKSAKRAERKHRILDAMDRTRMRVRNFFIVLVQAVGVLLFSAIVLLLIANGVNWYVRWNATKKAGETSAGVERERRSKENVLVVGVEGDNAVGFLAMRVPPDSEQAFGIAIPEGAFLEVPGAGFSRIGESWSATPTVTTAAISNYLTVPFDIWVAVPADAYRSALTKQNVNSVLDDVQKTNLSDDELSDLSKRFESVPQKEVAIVPMPVKPIKLGEQTYFEPQRDEVADLLESWWGVDPDAVAEVVRVIVYNGAGVPGVAGEAAQELIRSGFRVVDTKNADRFDYAKTVVVVKRGDRTRGESVADVLGASEVRLEPSDQSVTDVIVIVGKDYKPPTAGE